MNCLYRQQNAFVQKISDGDEYLTSMIVGATIISFVLTVGLDTSCPCKLRKLINDEWKFYRIQNNNVSKLSAS